MATARAEALDLTKVNEILAKYKGTKGSLIPMLQQAQDTYGYLPREVLVAIAKGLGVPLSQVYGVVTFYSQFYLTRRGRHIVKACDGTACHVRGAAKIIETLERELGVKPGGTTPDYQFTNEVVYCLGSCGLSPVAVIDNKVVGRLTPERAVRIVRGLREPAGGERAE
ncbi:MAG: NADH-quinone oxidoreductase subunit NuoE [Dehalococcoidales bacterium]|nr:NADH-quinone oxidoreductase subunit NuoE [Dehalococcoidales bacterium]